MNLAFDRVTRQSVLITHWIGLTKIFLTSVNDILKKITNLEIVYKFYLGTYNFWQGCQIADINSSLDWSDQYLCNEVVLDGFRGHFHSDIQHPTSKKYDNFTLVLITFGRVVRSSISFPHWKGLLNTFLTMCYLTRLVAKTTVLYNFRNLTKIVLCT